MRRLFLLGICMSTLSLLPAVTEEAAAGSLAYQDPTANACIQVDQVHYSLEDLVFKFPERGREVRTLLDQLQNAGDTGVKACPSNCACTAGSGSWAVTCVQGGCACIITGSINNADNVGSACHCTNT